MVYFWWDGGRFPAAAAPPRAASASASFLAASRCASALSCWASPSCSRSLLPTTLPTASLASPLAPSTTPFTASSGPLFLSSDMESPSIFGSYRADLLDHRPLAGPVEGAAKSASAVGFCAWLFPARVQGIPMARDAQTRARGDADATRRGEVFLAGRDG